MADVKGGKDIVKLLNEVLTNELTAINQYFVHAKMQKNWGLHRIAEKVRHESIDEMKHADQLIDRILYLEGVPNLQRLHHLRIGETPTEQLACDAALERDAIPLLNSGIELCRAQGDNGTRALLESILVSEEEHLDWIEEQLSLIALVGDKAWMAEQIRS